MEITSNRTQNKRKLTQDQAFALHGKVPPQALELEEAVLGAVMLEHNALTTVIDILQPEFFYKEAHQVIYKAIRRLFHDSLPIDMFTVVEALKKSGELEFVGGAYFITQLTERVVSAANIETHARIIAEKFIQRDLIRVSTDVITDAYDPTMDVLDLLDKAERQLLDIGEKNFRSDYRDMADLLREALGEVESAAKVESGMSGVPSGFTDLDRMTAGWQKSNLIILAARPAMGKTAFALSMAKNIAIDHKIPIAFFSLEMSAVELVMRLVSSESGISSEKLKKGQLANYEWDALHTKISALSEAPMFIDDTPSLTIFELRAKCRRLKQKHDIGMIFIDYLQLMNGSAEAKGNREQEISMISRQLKALAKELRVPVLALSQLSRAVETRGGSKKPVLSDLRESGAIEQDADIVMFIHRPEYYQIYEYENGESTLGMADIILAKHRNGAVGDVHLKFIAQFASFVDKNKDINYDLMAGQGGSISIPSKGNFRAEDMGSGIAGNTGFDNEGSIIPPQENGFQQDDSDPF